jgi:regulator of protease activity HflC (stomatin/prohibitin superfamily)
MKKVILVLLSLSLIGCGFEIVDTGHRGVKTTFGKVSSDSLPEGLYFYNPLSSDLTEIDVRIQSIEKDIQCYTKDIQQANVKTVLMVGAKKDSAHLLLQNFGKDWQERIVPQILEGTLKTVIGKWDAVDLVANREKARVEIEEALKLSFADKFLEVSKVELTNIDYNDEFEKAVEKKVVAVQSAIEAQNKTKQIEEEAKQKVISAEAEAQSMKIRSQALSQNQNLVQYEAVQKWNGVLPTYMMGNSVPFINIGNK